MVTEAYRHKVKGLEPQRGNSARASTSIVAAVVDQAAFSATSLCLAVVVGRASTPREFGAFGVVYLSYTLILGVAEAFLAEPLAVRSRSLPALERRRLETFALRGAVLAGVGFAAVITPLSFVLGGPFLAPGLAFAIGAPALFVQDIARLLFIARGNAATSARGDVAWLAVFAAGYLVVGRDAVGPTLMIGWLIVGGGVGVGLGWKLRLRWRTILRRRRTRELFALRWRYAVEFGLLYGASQSVMFLVAALGSLEESAGYRGAQLIFSPLLLLLSGGKLALLPMVGLGIDDESNARAWQVGRVAALVSAVATSVWLGIVSIVPAGLGRQFIGSTWEQARGLLPAFAVIVVGNGVAMGALLVLRSAEAARLSLPARVRTAFGSLLVGVFGATLDGARGASIGVGVVSCLGAIDLWRVARARPRNGGSDQHG